ncbi:MAG: ABC transporter ATP-binding protein, partial [Oscillospiraceae bacterium]
MSNAIEIKNLSKKFKDFSLENVNITLPRGYIMGFIGPNGAGKSTTISLMLNVMKSDGGQVFLNGVESSAMTKADKENIGVVLDESCFPETLTYIQIGKFMGNIYSQWEAKRFSQLCEHYKLPSNKQIKDYSKGMKMKLSIAAAMSHKAKLLILDEATSGLDPVVRDEILDMLLEFVQDEENSVFMSSHITSDLEKACDYITFINRGKMIFSMEKDQVLEKYGILRCANSDFSSISPEAVVGFRSTSFATDALVIKDKIPKGFVVDKA